MIKFISAYYVEIVFKPKALKEQHCSCLKRFGVSSQVAHFTDGDTMFYGPADYTSDGFTKKVKTNEHSKTVFTLVHKDEYLPGIMVGHKPANKGLVFTETVSLMAIQMSVYQPGRPSGASYECLPPGNYSVYVYTRLKEGEKPIAKDLKEEDRRSGKYFWLRRRRLETCLKLPGEVAARFDEVFFPEKQK